MSLWHPYPEIHENLLKSMETYEKSSKSIENRENQLKTMLKGRGRGDWDGHPVSSEAVWTPCVLGGGCMGRVCLVDTRITRIMRIMGMIEA